MGKTINQLKQEYTGNERELEQAQHKLQRLNNRINYYEKGDRQKRAHRLITMGAAIENLAPEVKALSEVEFYSLAEKIFSLPEVKEAIHLATVNDREI